MFTITCVYHSNDIEFKWNIYHIRTKFVGASRFYERICANYMIWVFVLKCFFEYVLSSHSFCLACIPILFCSFRRNFRFHFFAPFYPFVMYHYRIRFQWYVLKQKFRAAKWKENSINAMYRGRQIEGLCINLPAEKHKLNIMYAAKIGNISVQV